jgi:hypothetical protein
MLGLEDGSERSEKLNDNEAARLCVDRFAGGCGSLACRCWVDIMSMLPVPSPDRRASADRKDLVCQFGFAFVQIS